MFSGNLKDKRNEKSRNLDIFIRRNLNVDFLQEGMIRITIFLLVLLVYASTTRIQLKNSEIEKVGFPEQAKLYANIIFV